MSAPTETETKKYNGWTNYETWCVALWMDNDEGSQGYWQERAEEAVRLAEDKHEATYELAEEMKDQHEEAMSELLPGASVFTDLLRSALGECCWYEIASGKVEEVEVEE